MRLKCNRQVKVENVSPGPTAGELNVPYSFPPPSTSFIRHSQLMSIDCQDDIMHYVPDSFSSSLQEKKKNRIIKKTKTLLHSGTPHFHFTPGSAASPGGGYYQP